MKREDARRKVNDILGDVWLGYSNEIFRQKLATAILAAVAERDMAWREWLRLRFSDEWISTCGDLPGCQPEPPESADG